LIDNTAECQAFFSSLCEQFCQSTAMSAKLLLILGQKFHVEEQFICPSNLLVAYV